MSADPFRDFETLAADARRVQVLITSWGSPRIDPAALGHLPGLRLVAHLAGTVKGFIDECVWRQGIAVVNAVAANAVPVAEYTLGAILFANKQVLKLAAFYRQQHENRAPWTKEAPNVGNYRKCIGVIGASHVGRKVLDLLRAFDFKVLLYDPYITPLEARELGGQKVSLTELLCNADVVTLHAPLLPETRHMLGTREFALMRDGATFINTARGALVDQDAMIAELATGRINAVLDTTEPEVLPASSPLFRMPNVLLTPHIAGSLGTETQRLADQIIDEVERYARGQTLKHRVRFDELVRLA
ncbi:MAG: hydroxyacid dehydrogenase [Gammaproteobacteria bacterium]|nr:hydroxyacid dehydrogenase [Gammaproteobacteria bacterium]